MVQMVISIGVVVTMYDSLVPATSGCSFLFWCDASAPPTKTQHTLLNTELLQRHAKGVTLENESS
jgi:hypothetical protein